MRYITLIIIALFLSACGNQKIRFVKTNTTKQKVVELAEVPSMKKAEQSTQTPNHVKGNTEEKTEEKPFNNTTLSVDDVATQPVQNIHIEEADNPLPEITTDSTTVTSQEANDIAQAALRAQSQGGLSLLFSILAIVLAIVSIIALIFAFGSSSGAIIVGFTFFGIASFVSWILGIVFGISSLFSRFNTQKGRNRAIAGLIIAGLPLVWFILSLVF